MCLILLAHGVHPDYPLVIAANRDEYYRRPTAKAAFWQDHPRILAGRDLECMGTWLGVTRAGRFAALTNFRDPRERKTDAPSRGTLVSEFLASEREPREYLEEVATRASHYKGFNLLAGDIDGVFYFSSRTAPGAGGVAGDPRTVESSARYALAESYTRQTAAAGGAGGRTERRGAAGPAA